MGNNMANTQAAVNIESKADRTVVKLEQVVNRSRLGSYRQRGVQRYVP